MFIKQVSLGTCVIYVSSDDNFGLVLERNINVSNNFEAALSGLMKSTHRIMQVGTSISNNSFAINY